ncbi:lysozyme g-like [Acanthopagrus latus]|uniref:lysozyme g-like n=1 Tax=Acanthopagrus latus TaxID=8177 RepID=UPI00187CAD45|nr:lysozyme g-like [Acanthopagrus latus]
MPPKTVTSLIKDTLRDLKEEDFKDFCSEILDRRDEPRIRQSDLEHKSLLEVVGVLVKTFTESKVAEVVVETLESIRCNAQKESLTKYLRDASFSTYGDIMMVETTGASVQTAQQDKLKCSGVKASYAMAERDLNEMNKYKSTINNVADKKKVHPALIAGLISRSSRVGKTLNDGWGCYDENRKAYNTFGLMQIDVNPEGGGHKAKGSWDGEEHLCQAIDILIEFLSCIKNNFPDWSKERQLKGGIAAYHAGPLAIHSYEEVDAKTYGGDFSNDVVARAQWYKSKGGF